jgi:putative ABC transport system permease protein
MPCPRRPAPPFDGPDLPFGERRLSGRHAASHLATVTRPFPTVATVMSHAIRRGLASLAGLTLDLKLGFRMLVKHPGLTIVGGLAMAFGIWAGAVTFEVTTLFVNPTLPLPGGDRIVQLRNWDVAAGDAEPRALHDFLTWRGALRSVTDLGAYHDVARNLTATDGEARPVAAAEITASAFRIAPTAPLLGRVLTTADEQAGAPPVVVLGHDLWRTRFASDPGVIGRSVRLDEGYATVVGVMPEGFAFPVAHELWTPLRPAAHVQAPRQGPGITIFGRLAPDVTLDEARAELATLGRRAAAAQPHTHQHLQPQVGPYAQQFQSMDGGTIPAFTSIYVFAALLVVLVCSNVALLLFARAATRESELIVRTALGASRRRIVAQLFAEALVLGALAAAVGLGAAYVMLDRWAPAFLEINMGQVPFWYDPSLSPATVLYALGLTLLGAAIAGVMPGLKITRGLGSRLRAGTAGGGGPRFGGVWTAVIVTQVAVTVAFPAVVFVEQQELRRMRSLDVGFAAEEYLTVALAMDEAADAGEDSTAAAAHRARFTGALARLRERLQAEPGVAGVAFVDRLPKMYHRERRIEVDGGAPRGVEGEAPEVGLASIDPAYFDVLGAPVLAGRGFHVADLAPGAQVVVVDEAFVDEVLRGQNPIGQRFRFVAARNADGSESDEPRPWYEIVGVVKTLATWHPAQRSRSAGVYLPTVPGSEGPTHMIVHVRGDPLTLIPRVRALATDVEPALQLHDVRRADQVEDDILWIVGMWLRVTVVLTAIALLLSLAGIYAVLSFTVARRTREIGVRVALGANRARVVTAIFRRPLVQVGLGVAAGGVLIAAGAFALSGGPLSVAEAALLVAYVMLMLGVCLLACVVPTRRALAVEPTVALRSE